MLRKTIGRWLSNYLQKTVKTYIPIGHTTQKALAAYLKPGDVLLVEGNQRVSVAIKYLTQSTWSHAAVYVGDAVDKKKTNPNCLIEADLSHGVHAVPLSKYAHLSTRICRPHKLTAADTQKVVGHLVASIGKQYDVKNITDLLRYLIRKPPVPPSWRRRMLALGSGDPTRAICSSLIAEAFQKVRYPILPEIEHKKRGPTRGDRAQIMHIRHHSLFTPRDFDLSPYFQVIKPTLEGGFDYKKITWGDTPK